jgi:hypothetical protein
MHPQKPLPTGLVTRSFRVGDALDRDVTPSRLRSNDLEAPFHGMRVPVAEERDLRALCIAYLPLLGEGDYFSHLTAARLYGFPVRSGTDELDVSSPRQPPRRAGVIGHRGAAPVRRLGALPVIEPAAAWLQMTRLVSLDELVLAGDFLVRRRRPLCSPGELAAAVATPGARGISIARRAFAEVRAGTDSPMETRVRLLITRAGLPEPVIGHTVRDAAGGFIGTPDLAYVREKIAIEYEGDHHRVDRAVFADDIERRELMQEAGWYVIRVISDHVFIHHAWLVRRIALKLAERA